jgi:lysophospholipase L1-like esterase
MRRILSRAVLAVFLAGVVASAHPAVAASAPGRSAQRAPLYYVSLGDSLSRGMQADASGRSVLTDEGYADQLFGRMSEDIPNLRHVELGCHLGDESTAAMIAGGACFYPHGSQLEEAESFLHAHTQFVALVTIDIGGNDLRACEEAGQIDLQCVVTTLSEVQANLGEILARLRAAAGPDVPIVGMSYYNPVLAAWLQGPGGQQLAQLSTQLVVTLNNVEEGVYTAAGVPVAPVEEAFSTTDFTTMVNLPGIGLVPLNVARICQWTWMCIHGNIHANVIGYSVIADAFEAVIDL